MTASRLCSSLLAALAAALAAATAGAATLIHSYDFSGGVIDLVGGQNATLVGDANVSGGRLNLDGDADYAQFASFIVPTGGSYSVAFFGLRAVDQAGFAEMISQGRAGGPGFYIGSDPQGHVRVTDLWTDTGVPMGAVGTFTHYALVVDATAGLSSFYVDGLLVRSVGFAIQTSTDGTATRLGLQFGGAGEAFHGSLDDLRIYDGALTAQEVLALSAVPEPQALGLMVTGLLLVVLRAGRGRP
jgi:hypothetical protein